LNVSSIIRMVAQKSVIHQVPNITRAFVANENDKLILKTEGINILVSFVLLMNHFEGFKCALSYSLDWIGYG